MQTRYKIRRNASSIMKDLIQILIEFNKFDFTNTTQDIFDNYIFYSIPRLSPQK